jgi:hypothetical protein
MRVSSPTTPFSEGHVEVHAHEDPPPGDLEIGNPQLLHEKRSCDKAVIIAQLPRPRGWTRILLVSGQARVPDRRVKGMGVMPQRPTPRNRRAKPRPSNGSHSRLAAGGKAGEGASSESQETCPSREVGELFDGKSPVSRHPTPRPHAPSVPFCQMGVAGRSPVRRRLLSIVFVCFASPALAGDLTVRVLDPQHASVPGARIELTRGDASWSTSVVASDVGSHRFEALAPGSYLASASASGFATGRARAHRRDDPPRSRSVSSSRRCRSRSS